MTEPGDAQSCHLPILRPEARLPGGSEEIGYGTVTVSVHGPVTVIMSSPASW